MHVDDVTNADGLAPNTCDDASQRLETMRLSRRFLFGPAFALQGCIRIPIRQKRNSNCLAQTPAD
jgi:hypothetical protein